MRMRFLFVMILGCFCGMSTVNAQDIQEKRPINLSGIWQMCFYCSVLLHFKIHFVFLPLQLGQMYILFYIFGIKRAGSQTECPIADNDSTRRCHNQIAKTAVIA